MKKASFAFACLMGVIAIYLAIALINTRAELAATKVSLTRVSAEAEAWEFGFRNFYLNLKPEPVTLSKLQARLALADSYSRSIGRELGWTYTESEQWRLGVGPRFVEHLLGEPGK